MLLGTGGYRANVSLYEKGNNSIWVKKISTNGYVGKNGITDNKKEGDGKTPTGLYDLGTAFGVASNPGTKLSYRKFNVILILVYYNFNLLYSIFLAFSFDDFVLRINFCNLIYICSHIHFKFI